MNCPFCGNNLKLKLEKAPAIKKRPKKDPNEPVTVEQFIERNRKSKQKHVNIIAEWADELKEAGMLNGQYKTRCQWDVGFFNPNLKVAASISKFDPDQIREATMAAFKDLRKNGGFMDEVKLSTVLKKLNKGVS